MTAISSLYSLMDHTGFFVINRVSHYNIGLLSADRWCFMLWNAISQHKGQLFMLHYHNSHTVYCKRVMVHQTIGYFHIHCLTKFTLLIFVITRSNVDGFFIFSNSVAEEICDQTTYYSYNIQFVYEYYSIEKTIEIPYAFSAKNQEQRNNKIWKETKYFSLKQCRHI